MASRKRKDGLERLLISSLEGDDQARRRARTALARLDRDGTRALVRITRSRDSTLRWAAVDALGTLGDPYAVPAVLERTLVDPDPHARWRSIWALRRLDPEGGCVPALIECVIGQDGDESWNAAVVLSVYGRPEAFGTLVNGLGSRDAFRRWEAASGLGGLRDKRAVPALACCLHGGDLDLRKEAALSLGRIGGPVAVGALRRALAHDGSPEVRWRAAMALAWTSGKDTERLLRQALAKEKDARVRVEIKDALRTVLRGD